MISRLRTVATGAVLCFGVASPLVDAPFAAATPDYSGYQAGDPKPYQTYSTYGGGGVQFTSASGLLCRIVVISRGMFAYVRCFGPLAGVGPANLVSIDTSAGAGGFSVSSQSDFLTEQTREDGETADPVGTAGFLPLPVGSSLTYTVGPWSGTCAVDAVNTTCTVTATEVDSGMPDPARTKSFTLGPTTSAISSA